MKALRSATVTRALCAIALTGVVVKASSGQGNFPDRSGLTRDELRTFEAAFTAIARTNHVTVIADGVPLVLTLSDANLDELVRTVGGDLAGDLSREVADVAAKFDYDAVSEDGRVFLLRKRYSDPMDLPDVTANEIIRSLRGMIDVCHQVNPDFDRNADEYGELREFAASLTDAQKQQAIRGLPVSDMTAGQADNLRAALGHSMLAPGNEDVEDTYRLLHSLANPRSVFEWLTIMSRETFGFSGPFGPKGQIWQVALSNGFSSSAGGTQGPVSVNGKEIAQGDRTLPTSEDERLATGTDHLACTLRLDEAVREVAIPQTTVVSKSGDARIGPRFIVAVDDDLASKPVSVFGASYCEPLTLIRNYARVYGLELHQRQVNDYVIAMPSPRVLASKEDFGKEIERLVPLPIVFAMRTQEAIEQAADEDFGKYHPTGIAARVVTNPNGDSAFYFPAVRRLRVLTEPLVRTPDSKPYPIAKTGPEVRRLIAIATLSGDCVRGIEQLEHFRFSHTDMDPGSLVVHIRGPVGPGPLRGLNFGYFGPTGKFVAESGTSIPQPPPPK